jgi:hypothetical protein
MKQKIADMLNGEELNEKNILKKIKTIYKENYQDDSIEILEKIFLDVRDLFSGKRKGFLKCDTKYHDFSHTLHVIPPFIGIIDGWNKSGNHPKISKKIFNLGIIAVLLHDTGYIKSEDDVEGTGAKYTFVHIYRSTAFAEYFLSRSGFSKSNITTIQNIIMCTGVKVDIEKIRFNSDEERLSGYALGTSDLLGQMSASDYPEKLPALYHEFEEAYNFEGREKLREQGMAIFTSADDLIRKTPYFYEVIVAERFKIMGSMYQYLTYHFKDSRNYFIESIENNIQKIKLATTLQ